jgi:endonuclease YncB( thermonuclease family)
MRKCNTSFRSASVGVTLMFSLLSGLAQARSFYGNVSSVQSAEVMTVQYPTGQYTVRLFGVDAPETGAFSNEARQFIESRVSGREVRVNVMTRNAQNEMVSMVLVDGEDLALSLLRAGFARRLADDHYKPHGKDEPDRLVSAEDEARAAQRGIWGVIGKRYSYKSPAARPRPFLSKIERAMGTIDRNTSKRAGDDSECAIAIDPSNPLRMFQSCNVSNVAGMFAAFSSDGGVTWGYPDPADKTITDGDPGQGVSACCDPTLAWDRFGNLYLTYISDSLNSIETILSTDGGATFTTIASFSGSIDQPTVVAPDVGSGAAVWIVWNQSGAMVARGATATALGTVSTFSALQTIPGSSGCSFGDIAVSPLGAVVQVCGPSSGQGPANLRFNIDADGFGAGAFSASTIPTATNVGGFDFIPAQNGRSVDAESALAFDALSTSPFFGRLYLVYTDEVTNESNNLEINIRFSDNNGSTWSAPVRVNDDATTRSQFLPKLATDPTSGKVGVCWHDARNSATNIAAEMYCAISSNGGVSFASNELVSDGASTSNGAGVEFGDYMGMAFVAGKLQPVWGDTSNSTGDNPNGNAGFDAYTDAVVIPNVFGPLLVDGFESPTIIDLLFSNGFED